ncbi:hypothetical protein CPB84DRAFT_175216 [Gymnopilus junonius]|uniref:Uncharacterized protein n=1 Tax=Gymnopilus junonius TaxID=109634 RepID=A0A9P5TJK3_GYMJU|nr:hypothetical protein CPB84DRAFT_175216 [Gymnopilus junonius]
MDLIDLQELIESDGKYRFELLFDPLKGAEAWWIRARLWDERKYTLLPCRLVHGIRMAVYKTTLEEWNGHISRSGIPLLGKEYIQIDRTIQTEDYIDNPSPESQVFIFIDIQKCILSGLRFSYLVQISSHISRFTPLVTKGNHLNLIPPELFARVELVEARKTHLWGEDGVTMVKRWPLEPDDYDASGRRKTLLPLLGRGVHGFVDLREGVGKVGGDASASAGTGASEGGAGTGTGTERSGTGDQRTVEEAHQVLEQAEEEIQRRSPFDVQRPVWRLPEISFKTLKDGTRVKVVRARYSLPPLPLSPSDSSPSPSPRHPPLPLLQTGPYTPGGILKPWHPHSPLIPSFPRPRRERTPQFVTGYRHPQAQWVFEKRRTFHRRSRAAMLALRLVRVVVRELRWVKSHRGERTCRRRRKNPRIK